MLALITGSGFYNLGPLTDGEPLTVDTPFGGVELTRGRWGGGTEVLFLPRHGGDHSVPPHAINYRANMWALREAGAAGVVATAVSGAIDNVLRPGDFVLIDDFIDFTNGRPSTYFDAAGEVSHTDMSEPYDSDLRAAVVAAADSASVPLTVGGTYCATNGPRFETPAEIRMMRKLGGDLVGMTGCPEVVLANELGLPYASIGVISNLAAGLGDRELSVPEIMQVLADSTRPLERLLGSLTDQQGAQG